MMRYQTLVVLVAMLVTSSACATVPVPSPARSPDSTSQHEGKLRVQVGLVAVRRIDAEPDRLAAAYVYPVGWQETPPTP